jgi:streptogrisin C
MLRRVWRLIAVSGAILAVGPASAAAGSPIESSSSAAITQARAFREAYGLRSSLSWIRASFSNPASSSRAYGVPLFPSEVRALRARDAAGRVIPAWISAAERLYPHSFAGIYMGGQQLARGEIILRFTDHAAARARRVERSRHAPPRARIRAADARYSLDELSAVQQQIDEAIPALEQSGINISTTSVNEAGNDVLVGVANDSPAIDNYLQQTYGTAVYPFEQSVSTTIDTTIRVPPMQGGLDINTKVGNTYYDCTSGFDSTDRTGGYPVVITAGHCDGGGPGATGSYFYQGWLLYPFFQSNGHNGLGNMIDDSFHGGTTADVGSITIPGGWASNQIWSGNKNAPTYVVGVNGSDYVGETVCHWGITTGYRCGQITSTSSTINYGGSVIIYHMREATDYAYEGDSGGPFYTSGIGGVNAEGIESGITCASSTCSTSNVTGSIYSFITNAEAYANATVNSFP